MNEDATGDVIALQHQIRLLKVFFFFFFRISYFFKLFLVYPIICDVSGLNFFEQEELFFLKHQNISRSLSFGSITVDNMQAQENACVENIYELDQQEVDNSIGYESKGVVRMSTKQVC